MPYVFKYISFFEILPVNSTDSLITSNFSLKGYETFSKDVKHTAYNKRIIVKILLGYALVYFIYGSVDTFISNYQFELFFNGNDKYAIAGIFSAIYNATYGIGSYLAGKLNDKHDITRLAQTSAILISISMVLFAFVQNEIVIYLLFALFGLTYPFITVFVFQRLLVKTRILGVSNWAILIRENASVLSYIITFGFCLIVSVLPKVVFYPIFLFIALGMAIASYLIPKNEEKTRKLLVDFLQDNEIQNNERPAEQENNTIKAKK